MIVIYRGQSYEVIHQNFLGVTCYGLRSHNRDGATFPALKSECRPVRNLNAWQRLSSTQSGTGKPEWVRS